ncbi:MAG: RND family transporter [Sandaracinaceae bacterium]
MKRLIDGIAHAVTRRRAQVLLSVAIVCAASAVWIPSLEADPRPQTLTASSLENQAQISARYRERFGNPDHVVVLLIRADDVLAPGPLDYVHQVATAFQGRDYVSRVEGITVTPLAYRADEVSEETLDGLDDGETLDDLGGGETLDDLGGDPTGAGQDIDPALEAALGQLVLAAPEYFPMGLGTLANRMAEQTYGPIVEGDSIEEAERERLIAALEDAPLLEGRLISHDHGLTAVALVLDDRVEDHQVMQASVRDVDAWLAAHPPPSGVLMDVGGLPHLFDSIVVKMEHDNFRIVPLTLLVCLVLLYVSFRWVPGMVLPVVAVGLSALMVVGAMAFLGETMNVVNNIIPPLLIIIGVSDSIHLIGRYREELEHSKTMIEAAANTVRAMAVACFLTSITTSVGLASLLASQTEMLRRFGLIASFGVMIAYFVTIGFLPSAMTYFKPPLPPRARPKKGEQRADRGLLEKAIVVLTAKILRRPWPFIVGATLLFGGFVYSALQVEVDSALLDEFDEEDAAFQSTVLMEQELEGVRPLEIMLESDEPGRFHDPEVLAAVDEMQAWLHEQDAVLGSVAPTDLLHITWARLTGEPDEADAPFRSRDQVAALFALFAEIDRNPLDTMVVEDGRVGRIQVRLGDVGAAASLVIIDDLQARLHERFDPLGIRVSLTGEGYTGSVGLEAIVRDLLGSLSTAVAIIFALLVFLFGSWRLGLLSIPPNVIPLVGTMAWMSWRDIRLNAATVIVFSISLGLAVDGSIHLLARYREEIASGLGRNSALLRAARGTGRAVVVSCITLMLGFGVMLLSSFVPVRRFGELIGVTVGMCLLSTLVVQPALLRVWAPKTPPNRFRRPPKEF